MVELADATEANTTDQGKSKDTLKNILIFTLAAIVLIGISVGTTVYFLGDATSGNATEAGDEEAEQAEQAEQEPLEPPQYLAIKPALVVNFQNPKGARFLQVTVEVMARQEAVIEAVKHHLPVIRNSLVFMFSGQDSAVISSREGKESLRQQVLAEIQQILEEQTGEPGVEDVYFTSFVMQ